jgi:hypothetical protein
MRRLLILARILASLVRYNPPTPHHSWLSPSARLGAYEILTLIGSGGMGEVEQ